MMLLIPYFIVLVFLASYGIHRYVLVYLYYKNRKNASHSGSPPGFFGVTIVGNLQRTAVVCPGRCPKFAYMS